MGLLQSIVARFSRSSRASSTSLEEDARHRLGREGERLAARFLKREGYKVLYRHFRPRTATGKEGDGEIDLVCREGEVLVFVEVKTRTSTAFGTPVESVTRAQQEAIARSALVWLELLGRPAIDFRFDVVEVLAAPGCQPVVSLVRDAFTLPLGQRYVPAER